MTVSEVWELESIAAAEAKVKANLADTSEIVEDIKQMIAEYREVYDRRASDYVQYRVVWGETPEWFHYIASDKPPFVRSGDSTFREHIQWQAREWFEEQALDGVDRTSAGGDVVCQSPEVWEEKADDVVSELLGCPY